MSNPKILVVHLKEIIYTVIFAALRILLIILLVAMFPLVNPSLELISSQLYDGVLLEDIEFSENGQYTQTIMLDSIKVALEKAKVQP